MLNENDIQDLLNSVRHWLINGREMDATDFHEEPDQALRVHKLNALLKSRLSDELLAYRFKFR